MNALASLGQTRRAVVDGARDARAAWSIPASLTVVALAAALLAPAVLPLSGRMPDLAGFVYLAVAAVGLAYAVGLAGIPSLGQGAFLGIGAFGEAIARAKWGWPLLPALLLGVGAAAVAGALTGLATGRLRTAFVAVSTWLLAWIVALTLVSFPGISGGAQGLVLPQAEVLGHPLGPTGHYELGVVLLAFCSFSSSSRTRLSRLEPPASPLPRPGIARRPRPASASRLPASAWELSRPPPRSPASPEPSASSSPRSPTPLPTTRLSRSSSSSPSFSGARGRLSGPSSDSP